MNSASMTALLSLSITAPWLGHAATNQEPRPHADAWQLVQNFDIPIEDVLDGLDVPDIVGGTPTTGDPAVPALIALDGDGNPLGICTASLIDPRHLLTAAHCIDGDAAGYVAYFGTTVQGEDAGYIAHSFAEAVAFHERWNGEDLEAGHDIGVVRLVDSIPLTPLPYNRVELAPSDVGTPLRLVGWGITGAGNQDQGIKRHVASALAEVTELFAVIDLSETGACNGDSGGPMFAGAPGSETIIGVTSFGDTACQELVAYTRVDLFADWVANLVGGAPPGPGGESPGPGPAGRIGDACASGTDCSSGLCVQGSDATYCTAECTGSDSCPDGFGCQVVEGGVQVCLRQDPIVANGPTVTPKEAGGCSAAGLAGSSPAALALALLAVVLLRRRRC